MNRIIVLIPYFGKLPNMFPIWQQSAFDNDTVDFILFTDDTRYQTQKNVKIVFCTFEDCVNRFQKLFPFKISLPFPYKLCDYRPVFGSAFNEYINGYDFWGWCDLDVIFGNIRHFLTENVLNTYSMISGWGHFTLYRNNDFCNTFYKIEQPGFLNYKEVFSSPKSFCFDEYLHGGIGDVWSAKYSKDVWKTDNIYDVQIPAVHTNFFNFRDKYSSILEYNSGHLIKIFFEKDRFIHEEILYAHFQKRSYLKPTTNNFQHVIVVPEKIIEFKEITLQRYLYWTRPQRTLRLYRKLKNRLKKLYIRFFGN